MKKNTKDFFYKQRCALHEHLKNLGLAGPPAPMLQWDGHPQEGPSNACFLSFCSLSFLPAELLAISVPSISWAFEETPVMSFTEWEAYRRRTLTTAPFMATESVECQAAPRDSFVVEEAGEIHLCRQLECRAEHILHIQEFAGIDHEALLDLHRYAHGSPRWLLPCGRGVWRVVGFAARGVRCCCRLCFARKVSRVIRDEKGRERLLDPDSESEVEGDEASCQGPLKTFSSGTTDGTPCWPQG